MIINIYITKEENIKLSEISRKYQVSKSTIAETLMFYLTKHLIDEQKQDIITMLGNEYLYDNGKKTSIKPKLDPVNNGMYTNLTKAYTNIVRIYLHKDVKKFIQNVDKFYNEVNNKLQITNEPNWDFNHFRRQMARYESRK